MRPRASLTQRNTTSGSRRTMASRSAAVAGTTAWPASLRADCEEAAGRAAGRAGMPPPVAFPPHEHPAPVVRPRPGCPLDCVRAGIFEDAARLVHEGDVHHLAVDHDD